MGEEQKEVEEKVEEKKEEEEKKEDEPPPEIVIKVFMHCEACARKVERSLRRFEGVEEVKADCRAHTVVVKGKEADPVKICERLQKKTGRKIELISPLPKPPEEKPPEEAPKEEEKPPEPTPITVILKVRMHCEACAHVLEKRMKKMEGVESISADFANSQVIVKGFVDPAKLVENVYRKTRKQASIVEEEKKEEEKKEEEEEKKPSEGEEKSGDQEEKKVEEESNDDVKKFEYWTSKSYVEYVYAPQIFSDENPNACSVM